MTTLELTQPLVTTRKAAEILGVGEQTLVNWRANGNDGPAFVRLGSKAIRYAPDDLLAYIEKHRSEPTH